MSDSEIFESCTDMQIQNSQQITRTLLSCNRLLYSPISSSQLRIDRIVTNDYEEDETGEDGLEARFTKTVAVSSW